VRHRTLAFWKPYGVLSQFTPEPGSPWKTLADYIGVKGVYAAGRLDADSEGLLLLTSDGALQSRLTDPSRGHRRTYWVQVEGVPDDTALRELESGVMLQGRRTMPVRARLLEAEPALPPRDPPIRHRRSIPTSWVELTLTEGRNRQVRRMTAAVGYPTLRLVRWSIGAVTLEGLQPGCWREIPFSAKGPA
jgi:23S rRNA pseudouridine2457 synthase